VGAQVEQAGLVVGNKQPCALPLIPATIQTIFDGYDHFVLSPRPSAGERYMASALLACLTTGDASLKGKNVVFDNSSHAWDGLIGTVNQQFDIGMIKSKFHQVITAVNDSSKIAAEVAKPNAMEEETAKQMMLEPPPGCSTDWNTVRERFRRDIKEPQHKVLVFCSASLKPTDRNGHTLDAAAYQKEFYELGRRLAEQKIGIVFGGTDNGLMGALMRGAQVGNGWIEGVTIERFFKHEGIQDHCFSNAFSTDDVHNRVVEMVKVPKVDAIVAGPGSLGTLHEIETMRLLIESRSKLLQNGDGTIKPTYLLNLPLKDGTHFWDKTKQLLNFCGMFREAHSAREMVDQIVSDNFRVSDPMAGVPRKRA
jgi:predicted Rossmann-fold nucleotide-binding protein